MVRFDPNTTDYGVYADLPRKFTGISTELWKTRNRKEALLRRFPLNVLHHTAGDTLVVSRKHGGHDL